MAFASMIIVFLVIALLILGILLVVGLIFLSIGIVKRKNPKNKGKKHPSVFIVIGALLSLPAVVSVVFVLVTTRKISIQTENQQIQYECVPDKWRNEWVNDHAAAQEVLDALLKAADEGDKEAFALNFTPEIQEQSDFDDILDSFFESYPEGFSECNVKIGPVGGSGSYNYGHNVQKAGTSIDVVKDGEWYTIGLSFCYENTDNPEKVGVTSFNIMNLEGAAYFNSEYNRNSRHFKNEFLFCRIMSDQEISARLINDIPYLWTDTLEQKLTEDEMRELLNKYRDRGIGIPEVHDVIGEPNASRIDASGCDYYYELVQKEDGEPQYVHINTSTEKGKIIDAYLCDREREYYDNPMVKHIKQ